jgi:hypothetical protein
MNPGYFAMPLHPPGADPARTMEEDLEQLVTLDGAPTSSSPRRSR